MPPGGRLKDIEPDVMRIIDENWDRLREAWDEKYPENPISSVEDADGDEDYARDRVSSSWEPARGSLTGRCPRASRSVTTVPRSSVP